LIRYKLIEKLGNFENKNNNFFPESQGLFSNDVISLQRKLTIQTSHDYKKNLTLRIICFIFLNKIINNEKMKDEP